MLLHVCSLASLAFAGLVARLDAGWIEVPLLAKPRSLPLVSIIVPARDADALARTFQHYLAEPKWWRAQSAAALEKAGQFTLDRLAASLARLEADLK